jgi:hypothetical protein
VWVGEEVQNYLIQQDLVDQDVVLVHDDDDDDVLVIVVEVVRSNQVDLVGDPEVVNAALV